LILKLYARYDLIGYAGVEEVEIVVIEHALERMAERGATFKEIQQVIEAGQAVNAKIGRKAKEMVFDYDDTWLGKRYAQKKVKVVFVEESDRIVATDVYAFMVPGGRTCEYFMIRPMMSCILSLRILLKK